MRIFYNNKVTITLIVAIGIALGAMVFLTYNNKARSFASEFSDGDVSYRVVSDQCLLTIETRYLFECNNDDQLMSRTDTLNLHDVRLVDVSSVNGGTVVSFRPNIPLGLRLENIGYEYSIHRNQCGGRSSVSEKFGTMMMAFLFPAPQAVVDQLRGAISSC